MAPTCGTGALTAPWGSWALGPSPAPSNTAVTRPALSWGPRRQRPGTVGRASSRGREGGPAPRTRLWSAAPAQEWGALVMRAGAGADADTVVRLYPRGSQKPLSLLGAEEQGWAGAGPARGGCWGHGWGTLPGGVAAVQRGPLRCPELDAPQGWFGVPVASVPTCHLKAVIRASASWPSASPLASPTGPHEPQALTRQAPAVRLCACACTRTRQPRASLHPWGLAQGPPARGTRRGRGGSRWPEAPRQRPPWCGALCVRLWPGTGAGRATPSRSRRKAGGRACVRGSRAGPRDAPGRLGGLRLLRGPHQGARK